MYNAITTDFEYIYIHTYSAVIDVNCTMKYILCFISTIFPTNHWWRLDMLSGIVFVKGKSNAIEYPKMLHGEFFSLS